MRVRDLRLFADKPLTFVAIFVIAVTGGQSMPAFAQQSAIEEITVTARKREESVQDIPIAVTALTSGDIEGLGATAMGDLVGSVPNLMMDPNGNSLNSWGMRGVVSVTRNAGQESGLGVYIDGVYAGRPASFNLPMNDIQQVEVLRGPQGSLFGRNTIAGAINVTTKRPGEEFSGNFKISAGNYSALNVEGGISGPIVGDVLSGKISLYSFNRDGFVDNIADGRDYMSDERSGGRFGLYWTPSDTVEIILAGDVLEQDNRQLYGMTLEPQLNAFIPDWYQSDDFTINQNDPNSEEIEAGGFSLTANWDIGGEYTLTSITAKRYTDFELFADDDAGPITLTYSHFMDDSETFSQEFRLTSPANDRFDYVVGLYFLDQEITAMRETPLVPYPDNAVGIFSDSRVDSEAWAAFGTANFYFTDQLTLSVGLRYTDEEKTSSFTQIENAGLGFPSVSFNPTQQDDAVSGDISLTYAVNDDVNLYGSVRKGVKSGGFQTDIIAFATESLFVFGPEDATSLELGLKSDLADGRLRLNAAVFRTDYTDMQVGQLLGLGFTTTNAGESEINGLEIEADWLATDNLTLGVALGSLDHEYTQYADCGGFGVNCDGNDLQLVPDITATITADYVMPLGSGASLDFHVDYNKRGEYFTSAVNDPDLIIEDRSLLNARVGYISSNENIRVYLWAKNLTDESYDSQRWKYPVTPLAFGGADPTITGLERLVGAPRTYGLEVSFEF